MAVQRHRGIGKEVVGYLNKNRNQNVSANDLASDLGLTKDQVYGAIGHLKAHWQIDSPTQGWYIFRGPLPENGDQPVTLQATAEVVALLTDDRLLINVEGSLYVAKPLEI